MINEIMAELKYCFWMCVILSIGMLSCMAHNHYYTWENAHKNWHYNLTPSEGSGWINSIVKSD